MLLKYLSNFWRTSKISLISCEVSPDLTWSANCVIFDTYKARKFAITDAKLYVLIISLSTQINAKLIQQLKSGFKQTINWNKYQSKGLTQVEKQYLDYSIDPSFQGVKRLFVLLFKNETE